MLVICYDFELNFIDVAVEKKNEGVFGSELVKLEIIDFGKVILNKIEILIGKIEKFV